MIQAGILFQEVYDALRRKTAADMDEVKRSVNVEYWKICHLAPWDALRATASLDFTGKDSDNAMLLPGDLAGIEAVWDGDNYEYLPGSKARTKNDLSYEDYTKRYYFENAVATPLASGIEYNVDNRSTSFTLDTTPWVAAWIGEYIRFSDQLGVYEITATNTIGAAFRGKKQTSAYAEIRPGGTKRMSVRDHIGAFVEITASVHYWRTPLPLLEDYDPILLPGYPEALELAVLARILGPKDRKTREARDYKEEYRDALSRMIGLNPRPIAPKRPLDRRGIGIQFK